MVYNDRDGEGKRRDANFEDGAKDGALRPPLGGSGIIDVGDGSWQKWLRLAFVRNDHDGSSIS